MSFALCECQAVGARREFRSGSTHAGCTNDAPVASRCPLITLPDASWVVTTEGLQVPGPVHRLPGHDQPPARWRACIRKRPNVMPGEAQRHSHLRVVLLGSDKCVVTGSLDGPEDRRSERARPRPPGACAPRDPGNPRSNRSHKRSSSRLGSDKGSLSYGLRRNAPRGWKSRLPQSPTDHPAGRTTPYAQG